MPETMSDLRVLTRAQQVTHVPLPRRRWKTRVLLPGLILAAFASLLAYAARDALWPATPVRVVLAVAKSASGASGAVSSQASGWVEPDPFPTYVSTLADGVVKEMLVNEGETVKAGQVIARLVDDEAKISLARQEAEVRHHQADVAEAEARLKAAEKQWENPVERTRAVSVAEGMLAETRAEIAKLETDAAVESARVEELEEQLRRETQANQVKAISDGQLAQTTLRLKAQRAMLESTRARRAVLEAKLKQQDAELLAAKEHLRLRIMEAKELEEMKAALNRAHAVLGEAVAERDMAALKLARMEVKSLAEGVVMTRMTEPGGTLMLSSTASASSSQAAKLYDPKKLQVRVDVPLSDAAKVSVGQDALVVVEVLRDKTFKGKVTRIVHQADNAKNTLQFKVAIENPDAELKPEMLARVQFLAPAEKAAAPTQRVFAPDNLLQKSGTQAAVWLVDKTRGVAQRRTVTLGTAKQDGWTEVAEGLHAGDALIASETAGLREGQKVRMIESGSGFQPEQKMGGQDARATEGEAHGSH